MIALIHPNLFSPPTTANINFLFETIREQIEAYIEILPLKENSLSDTIFECLKPETSYIIHTEKCYSDEDNTYQLCHVMSKGEKNGIGISLNEEHAEINGNIILMKFGYLLDKYEIENITINEIVNVLQHTLIHSGLIIRANNNIDKFSFKLNPFEWMSENEIKNLAYFEIEILEMVLYIYIQKNPENDKLNEMASALLHENDIPIIGDIYLLLTDINGYFISFDKTFFDKLLVLMSGEHFDRNLTEKENKIKNSFIVVKNRYAEYIKTHSNKFIPFKSENKKTLNEISKENS